MPPSVDRRTLAPGLTVSRVLTGLWQLADMERDGRTVDLDRAAAAMAAYVDAGLTTFDMADHYGPAELVAGRYRANAPAASAQLLTKWVPRPGPVSKADVRSAVERALTRLQADTIELLQFHAWNYADPAWLETLYHLQELKGQGLIRHLGLTNVDTAHLRIVVASGIEVVSNQVSFSLLDQRAAHGLAQFCLQHDVHLLAYGTIAGGWLSERWLGQEEPEWERDGTWSQMKYGRFIRAAGGWSALQRVLQAAASVAGRHGVSIANVASRFILEQPGVAGVIIGARLGEQEHIADTLRLFSFSLTEADRGELRRALETLQPIPGDCGDEYRKPPFLTASGDLSHHFESMPPPYEVVAGRDGRTRCFSGTLWEPLAGYARAVRHGRHISVSGTTATLGSRLIGGSDPAAQAHFAIDKIEGALQSLGATLNDVVRTRVYVKNVSDWEAVARAHGARFSGIMPANTLVAAPLIGDEYLVEIEADAETGTG
jgi:aryl-alcohol dehydrogenase-like predicted oxidoreductase/enamine deaminase RidA (YjgF/YER057c/UK114 family)